MNYNEIRRKTKEIKVGGLIIGGTAPVSVQSMTNTSSTDYDALYRQIKSLEAAGCDIVRLTVPDIGAADTFFALKEAGIAVPLVAEEELAVHHPSVFSKVMVLRLLQS